MVAAMADELGVLGIPFFCGGRGGTPRVKKGGDDGGGGAGDGDGEDGYGIEEGELSVSNGEWMDGYGLLLVAVVALE